MKKVLVFAFMSVFCSSFFFALDPIEILQKSDKAYFPSKAKFHMLIETYDKGTKKQWFDMDCTVNGNAKYLLVFKDPAIMKGQGQLRLDDVIFSYVRKTDKISQVSARVNFHQSVLSQEDIMSTMLSSFYTIESFEELTVDGKSVYRMVLLAKAKRSAYAKIIADIDSRTLLPVHRSFYAQSGQLIKEMKTDKISKNGDVLSYVQFRVIDVLKQDNYSIVTMDQFDVSTAIQDSWFSQSYLKTAVK